MASSLLVVLAVTTTIIAKEIGPALIDDPCNPQGSAGPCGTNAVCRVVNLEAICTCPPNLFGNPYVACTPECAVHADCPAYRACLTSMCVDPCVMACGENTYCEVVNHQAICRCADGYEGDPFVKCLKGPCAQSPCGENARCVEKDKHAICTCPPHMIGDPLVSCQEKECKNHTECPEDKACMDTICADPCVRVCGENAACNVIQNKAVCTCLDGYKGNPLEGCTPIDPCAVNPCGLNAQCKKNNGRAVCFCPPDMTGDPFVSCSNIGECVLSLDCPKDKACLKSKCRDPCAGSCGENSKCTVVEHKPVCTCAEGYQGNAWVSCVPI